MTNTMLWEQCIEVFICIMCRLKVSRSKWCLFRAEKKMLHLISLKTHANYQSPIQYNAQLLAADDTYPYVLDTCVVLMGAIENYDIMCVVY